MMHFLVLIACLAAFATLAMATRRQQRDLFGGPLSRAATMTLRLCGFSGLLFALSMLVKTEGFGLGLVMFSGHTSLAAAVVYLALVRIISVNKTRALR
jgi:hypothetical protein